jgi:hypothetical protein
MSGISFWEIEWLQLALDLQQVGFCAESAGHMLAASA